MKRRLACTVLSAAACLLLLRPQPPPEEDEPQQPPQEHLPRRVEALSAAAAHAAALLPPCLRAEAEEDGLRGRLRVLRAYEDRRGALPAVRVLATLEGPGSLPPLFCQLWRQGRSFAASRDAPTEIWWPSWDPGRKNESLVRPFLISCPFAAASPTPESVSIGAASPCRPSPLHLPVQPYFSPRNSEPKRGSVAVCVKGLDFPAAEDFSARLLEWFEANSLLGAATFRLYLRTKPHPNVQKTLHFLRGRGVQVFGAVEEAHSREELDLWQRRRLDVLDLTDCLYRSIGRHQFVLALDIDEVLVPVEAPNWQALLSQLSQEAERYASLSVQSYFFFTKEKQSLADVTWRSANLTLDTVKSFVSTSNALTLFNHYALHTLIPGVLPRLVLDQSLAQVNHYRRGCPILLGSDCNQTYFRFRHRDTVLSDKIGLELRKKLRLDQKLINLEIKK